MVVVVVVVGKGILAFLSPVRGILNFAGGTTPLLAVLGPWEGHFRSAAGHLTRRKLTISFAW